MVVWLQFERIPRKVRSGRAGGGGAKVELPEPGFSPWGSPGQPGWRGRAVGGGLPGEACWREVHGGRGQNLGVGGGGVQWWA